jgi:hypothetical protein
MHDQTLLVHGDNSHLRIRHTFASSNAFLGRIHIEANGIERKMLTSALHSPRSLYVERHSLLSPGFGFAKVGR